MTVKLNVPYIVGDVIRNPGEEVDLMDPGREAFALGMKHAEAVEPPPEAGRMGKDEKHELGDKDKKPMGIFGKPEPDIKKDLDHPDHKKGK
jgi:hypothetical protein